MIKDKSDFKRMFEGRPGGNNGRPTKYNYGMRIGLELFDMKSDPNETTDVSGEHPEVLARMTTLADDARRRLGDTLNDMTGDEVRPPRKVPAPEKQE